MSQEKDPYLNIIGWATLIVFAACAVMFVVLLVLSFLGISLNLYNNH